MEEIKKARGILLCEPIEKDQVGRPRTGKPPLWWVSGWNGCEQSWHGVRQQTSIIAVLNLRLYSDGKLVLCVIKSRYWGFNNDTS
jgi:hypothetical protein